MIKKRVSVDFDSESYYLDGEYWESWDNYGEEMADAINELLNEQDARIKDLEARVLEVSNSYLDKLKECINYKRLFKEFSYYFKDIKSLNELDHKDFEALQLLCDGEYL